MWVELFLLLCLAHLLGDFVFQTDKLCKKKVEKKARSPFLYLHAGVVFVLTYLFSFSCSFWWCAILIGITHLGIDLWKVSRKENLLRWFLIDQILHILIILVVSISWCNYHLWSIPECLKIEWIRIAIVWIICSKPANIIIKMVLSEYSVKVPSTQYDSFKVGALIGVLERWLILIFVLMNHYDAIGLLIAAKSILRFRDSDTSKTEYVLAGTLLSICIAVICGLFTVI